MLKCLNCGHEDKFKIEFASHFWIDMSYKTEINEYINGHIKFNLINGFSYTEDKFLNRDISYKLDEPVLECPKCGKKYSAYELAREFNSYKKYLDEIEEQTQNYKQHLKNQFHTKYKKEQQ